MTFNVLGFGRRFVQFLDFCLGVHHKFRFSLEALLMMDKLYFSMPEKGLVNACWNSPALSNHDFTWISQLIWMQLIPV